MSGRETVHDKNEDKEVFGGIKADSAGNEERPGEDCGEKRNEERPREEGGEKGNEVPAEIQTVIKKKRGRKPKIKGSETPVEVKSSSKRDNFITLAGDRPAREKKSVERFIADTTSKKKREIVIQKGSGTALKDIPNVLYKLSKRNKADNTIKDLHSVLYGKRAKAPQMKNNILQFSGFVWDESKNNAKVKEKLEKFHKEGLTNLCDVLDLHVSKAATKKEELVAKLIEFLEAPHITTDILLEETQQKLKRKKRKRTDSGTPGKSYGKSAQKRQKNDSESVEVEGMNKEVDKNEEEAEKRNAHTEENEAGEEPPKGITNEDTAEGKKDDADHISKRKSSKGSPKKVSKRVLNEENMKGEDKTTGKQIPEKTVISSPNFASKKSKKIKTEVNTEKYKGETEDKVTRRKGPRGTSKHTDKQGKSVNSGEDIVTEEASDRIRGRKSLKNPSKRIEKHQGSDFIDTENAVSVSLNTPVDIKTSGTKLHAPIESEAARGKRQRKKQTTEMAEGNWRSRGKASLSYPTDEELCSAIREFLNEVDFETATLSDIVNRLGERFNQDFRERKAHMKSLIQEELTRIAEEDDEDDAEENQYEG